MACSPSVVAGRDLEHCAADLVECTIALSKGTNAEPILVYLAYASSDSDVGTGIAHIDPVETDRVLGNSCLSRDVEPIVCVIQRSIIWAVRSERRDDMTSRRIKPSDESLILGGKDVVPVTR